MRVVEIQLGESGAKQEKEEVITAAEDLPLSHYGPVDDLVMQEPPISTKHSCFKPGNTLASDLALLRPTDDYEYARSKFPGISPPQLPIRLLSLRGKSGLMICPKSCRDR